MSSAIVVLGHLTRGGRLELDQPVGLPPGPVRVSVEPLSPNDSTASHDQSVWPNEHELKRRKAAMMGCLGCLSDDETESIIQVIEEEFEHVDPNEWR
ncbi:MAG: hypothetical protein ACO1SX_13190 [Actinomycetota bacterium]